MRYAHDFNVGIEGKKEEYFHRWSCFLLGWEKTETRFWKKHKVLFWPSRILGAKKPTKTRCQILMLESELIEQN